MKKICLFCAALALVGLNWSCDQIFNDPDQEQTILGDTLQLEYGETLTLFPDNIEVRFDSVFDSRCPALVDCAWAGMAEVRLWFRQNQVEQTGSLNTSNIPEFITVFGKTVRLIDVSPYPQEPQDIAQEDYIVRIVMD